MKKLKTLLRTCAITLTLLCTSSLSGTALEVLIISRDDSGNVKMSMLSEDETFSTFEAYDEAFNYGSMMVGNHGEVIYTQTKQDDFCIYVITDNSGFQWEFMKYSWFDDPEDWIKCMELTSDSAAERYQSEEFAGYKQGYADWLNQYGSDVKLYRLSWNPSDLELPPEFFRKSMMQFDEILDVVYMNTETTSTVQWNGQFKLTIQEDYEGLGENHQLYLPEELVNYEQEQINIYQEWHTAYTEWLNSIDTENMTPAQIELSRKKAGIASDAEMMQIADNACEYMLTEYSEIYKWGIPNYSIENKQENIYPESIWEAIGDLDHDGKLTDADAALLLQAIADQAVGKETDISVEADVNADDEFNASDAALILSYVAKKGTGSKNSLSDFIRKQYRKD